MTPETLHDHLLQLDLYNHLKTVAGYRSALRAAGRGFWAGTFSYDEFIDAFVTAIDIHFPRAWGEGMKAVGLSYPEDATLEERNELDKLRINEKSYIDGFANAIEAASKANGGKLADVYARIERWVIRYNGIKSQAMQMASNDPALVWVRNAADSCSSCLRLDGQVRRASTWRKYDLRPQSKRLECMKSSKGVPVCKCQLMPTQAPLTRGRFPAI
ncbi:MAG TPA: hypothetical protein P5318_19660 [Candidatus Hydrogenedentes bacterium]|nr:hypothetical protein [Candidatus Hydrogenedentota bacterium]